jgi:hypothetical protein
MLLLPWAIMGFISYKERASSFISAALAIAAFDKSAAGPALDVPAKRA